MLNWHPRFIDTKDIEDEELRKWLENPRSKASWVAKSMDKIWFLRHDFKLLRKLSFGIFRVFKNREERLAFSKYFGSAGVSREDWEKIEEEAKQKGLLKKGGLMGGFMRHRKRNTTTRQARRHATGLAGTKLRSRFKHAEQKATDIGL